MSTSLTLQALLKSTITRADLGAPGATRVSGLTPSARALYLAAAANRQAPLTPSGTAGATLVVVVPTDADVEQVSGDIRFFLGVLEGLSDSAAGQAVLPFPSHEVDPYRGLAPHLGVLSARARALHAAATGSDWSSPDRSGIDAETSRPSRGSSGSGCSVRRRCHPERSEGSPLPVKEARFFAALRMTGCRAR